MRWRFRFAIAALAVLAAFASSTRADAQPAGTPGTSTPTGTLVTTGRLVLDSMATSTGPVRVVKLEGWPAGPVTISICGNEARRATEDCDLSSAFAAVVPETGNVTAILPTAHPPIGCPCIVQVATKESSLVRSVPIELPGVPVLRPEERPKPIGAIPAAQLDVVAALEPDEDATLGDRALALFGGPVHHTLVLTLHNTGTTPMRNLTVIAAAGSSPTSGASLALPAVGALAPGEQRALRTAVTVPAPAVGTWFAHGTIYGTDAPVPFSSHTESRPWGLFALAVLAAGLLVRRVVRRRRRRRRRPGSTAPLTTQPKPAPATGARPPRELQSTSANARRTSGETVGEQRG